MLGPSLKMEQQVKKKMPSNNKKRKKIAHYEKSSKANRRIIEIEAQSISFTHVQMFIHKVDALYVHLQPMHNNKPLYCLLLVNTYLD
jgi:hypothetical protein